MDFSELPTNAIFIVVMILLMAGNFFLKKRRGNQTPLGRVASMLTDIRKNAQLANNFDFHQGIKKFNTSNWFKGKDKIDFVPQNIVFNLSKAFEMADEFNQRIVSAKKFGSDSYLAGIDVEKLKAPLATSDQELTHWLQENMDNPDFASPKRRGLFG